MAPKATKPNDPRANKIIGLNDRRVDICYDRGNDYYDIDHPISKHNNTTIPQDGGPGIFELIRNELHNSKVEKGSSFYVPRGLLRDILTLGRLLAVVQQLWTSLPEKEQQNLCTRILYKVRCWKVFLLFIEIGKEKLLPKVWEDEKQKHDNERLSDQCLPLAAFEGAALKCRNAKHTHPAPQLGLPMFQQAMVAFSYAISAVYLKLPTRGGKNHVHYCLGPKDVLPFTVTSSRARDSSSTDSTPVNEPTGPSGQGSKIAKNKMDQGQDDNLHGGFGEVTRVEIDRSHFDFGHLGSDDGKTQQLAFALKRLHASDKDAFDKELASLITVKAQQNGTHLIKLLTTLSVVEQEGGKVVFYLLFPWAEGNLWKYWEVHQPTNEQERVSHSLWMAQQCHQLALALQCVHNERHITLKYYDVSDEKGELYGRHGDIKAENVLYFEADRKLVLSDFGLGRLHTKYLRSAADPKTLEKSATYRAPEFDLANGRISQASDIFSLGCLFLDLVTWHIMGYDAVYHSFPKYRMEEDTTYGFESDIFFRVKGDTAIIKPKVHEWMDILKKHEKASEYNKQFLDIIGQMLEPDPKNRINVAKLVKQLDVIRKTCEGDPSYYGALLSQPY